MKALASRAKTQRRKVFLLNYFLWFLRLGGGLGAKILGLGLPVIQFFSKKFGKYFQPSEEKLRDEKFLRSHAVFLLKSMVCGAAIIRELDAKARSVSLSDGVAIFEIEGMDAAGCLKISGGEMMLADSKNFPKPDVRITFCDPMVLVEASQQKLDSLAAVGLGRIKICGLVPMADALNLMMDRLGVCLKV